MSKDQQGIIQKPLRRLALGEKRPSIDLWAPERLGIALKDRAEVGSYTWKAAGDSLMAVGKVKSRVLDFSQVRVAHLNSITADDAKAFLDLTDIDEASSRTTHGASLAIRGNIAPQYRINERNQLVENETLESPLSRESHLGWKIW